LLEARAGSGSQLYRLARDLVRAAQERAKPNSERLPVYTDSRLPLLEKELLEAKPIYPALEELQLSFWLSKIREYLTADAPETAVFLARNRRKTSPGFFPPRMWPTPRFAKRCGMAASRRYELPMIL